MKNNQILDALEKKIAKLEKENKSLKARIKEIHIDNEFLEKDLSRVKSIPLYKIWQIFRSLQKTLFK